MGITPGAHIFKTFRDLGLIDIIILLIGVSLVKSLCQGFIVYISNKITLGFRFHIRKQLVNWLLSGRRVPQGTFLSLFGETTNSTGELLIETQGAITNICLALAIFMALFYFSPVTTLSSILLLGIFALPVRRLIRKIKTTSDHTHKLWDRLNRNLILMLKNLFFIRIYGLEKDVLRTTEKGLLDFFISYLRAIAYSAVATGVPQFAGVLLLVTVCLMAKNYNLISDSILLPYLYLFFRFTQHFSGYLRQYSNVSLRLTQFQTLYGWWIHNVFQPENISEKTSNKVSPISIKTRTPIGWEIENVSFTYPESSQLIFSDISLNIKPGEICVITGKSGRGKSTLINLLTGDLIPQSGSVISVWQDQSNTIHKTPVIAAQSSIQRHLGYVSSENFIFAGTIKENLLFGLETIPSERDITEALKRTHCDFLINDVTKLNSQIGDSGEGLSVGQRQRLCLARALLRKPLVLILDEATSNLDTESQNKFMDTLKTLKGHMTIIVITHRLELLSIADQHIDLEVS